MKTGRERALHLRCLGTERGSSHRECSQEQIGEGKNVDRYLRKLKSAILIDRNRPAVNHQSTIGEIIRAERLA
jgi:hypothetical protein